MPIQNVLRVTNPVRPKRRTPSIRQSEREWNYWNKKPLQDRLNFHFPVETRDHADKNLRGLRRIYWR